MENITTILSSEVKKYAGSGRGANIRLFALLDDEHRTYAVNAVSYPRTERNKYAGVVVLARISGDKIIIEIEEDATDKPLYEALLQQGIPRERIVLAYAGEKIPDANYYTA